MDLQARRQMEVDLITHLDAMPPEPALVSFQRNTGGNAGCVLSFRLMRIHVMNFQHLAIDINVVNCKWDDGILLKQCSKSLRSHTTMRIHNICHNPSCISCPRQVYITPGEAVTGQAGRDRVKREPSRME